MNNLRKENSELGKDSTSADFFENQIISCPERAILTSSLSQLKVLHPRLIVYDISHNFYPREIQLSLVEKFKGGDNEEPLSILHDKTSLTELLNKMTFLFNVFHSLIENDGFLAVKVNGSIKAQIKQRLDSIFHLDNFMNEIIINSPIHVHYSKGNAFFERTEYLLVYSTSTIRKINPVYNEKESGGYWHSFVSKGQGSPKKFLIDGKLILLNPPSGTHWKLKQESIIKLCEKGFIRLNRRGNPEYWVVPKIGRIIDTNWLDLAIPGMEKHQESYFTRLFKVLLKPKQLVVVINPNNASSLIEAFNYDLRWVCLVENKKTLETLKFSLTQEKIEFVVKIAEKRLERDAENLGNSQDINIKEKPYPDVEFGSLSPISIYHDRYGKKDKFESNSINRLIYGDCFCVLHLIQSKYHQAIKLIYIDPPFYTGYDESVNIPFRNSDDLNLIERNIPDISIKAVAYENALLTGTPIQDFKRWFKERVSLMRPLLRLDGFIFVRFDYHFGHYAKEILDEVFCEDNFVIELIIRRMKKNLSEKQLNQQTHLIVHSDSLFLYRVSNQAKLKPELIKKRTRKNQDIAETEYSADNLWIDIAGYQKIKRTIYPTENSETLLERVINISTSKGDIVADFFAGSGTTLAMAEKLERKWLGTDIGKLSVNEIRKRILQLKERSPFEFQELTEIRVNNETKRDCLFEFEVKIDKKLLVHGTRVDLTLINLIHSPALREFEKSSFIDLIDYWEIDWNYKSPRANITWISYRDIKRKKVEKKITVSASHEYSQIDKPVIWVNVIDILGNSSQKSITIDLLK